MYGWMDGTPHTGALLGALLGASKGMAAFPARFIDGLVDGDAIRREVNTFADLAVKRSGVTATTEGAGTDK